MNAETKQENCLPCKKHDGIERIIETLQYDQRQWDGTVQRIWGAIESLIKSKLSLAVFIPLAVAAMAFVAVLFGLIYNSQSTLLEKVSSIKETTIGIQKQVEAIEKQLPDPAYYRKESKRGRFKEEEGN